MPKNDTGVFCDRNRYRCGQNLHHISARTLYHGTKSDHSGFESSPHLAAELAGIQIDLRKIVRAYHKIRNTWQPDVLFLESAGGVCVPLNQRQIMADIPADLAIPAIVVADASLGTINHTTMTVNELRRHNVTVRGVILNRFPENAGILIRDNLKMIEKFARVEVLACAAPDGGFFQDAGLKRLFG